MTLPYVTQLTKQTGERGYISSGGSSIHVVLTFQDMPELGAIYLGTCISFSYSVYREKTPVFNLGENVIDGFQINKKYVAGSMVNAVLGKDEIAEFINQYSNLLKTVDMQNYQELQTYTEYKNKTEQQAVKKFHTFMKDDLTSFNVDLIFTQEYTDEASRVTIYGCNFINNGQVLSIHDLIQEYTLSFVAKDIREMHDLNAPIASSYNNEHAPRYKTATSLLAGFQDIEEVIDNQIPDFGQIKIPDAENLSISPSGKLAVNNGHGPIVKGDYNTNFDEDQAKSRIKNNEGSVGYQSKNNVRRQDGTMGPSYENGKFIPYYDQKGNLTVGYGHLITDVNNARPLTDSEAEAQFNRDYTSAQYDASKIMKDYNLDNAPGQVKDVLNEMTFQMGEGGVREFEAALNAAKLGDYDKMAREMLDSKWAREDSPNRANALANKIKTIRRGK